MASAFSKSICIQILLSIPLILFGMVAIYLIHRAHSESARVTSHDLSDGSEAIESEQASTMFYTSSPKSSQAGMSVPPGDEPHKTQNRDMLKSLKSLNMERGTTSTASGFESMIKRLEKLKYDGYMQVGDVKLAWLSDGKDRIAVGEGDLLDDTIRIDGIHENFLLVSAADGREEKQFLFTRSPDELWDARTRGHGDTGDEGSDYGTVIHMDPALRAVKSVGEVFTVRVKIDRGLNVFAVPFDINYNPDILEVTGLYEGSYLKKDGGQTTFLTSVYRDKGKITIGLTRLGRIGGVSGSGTLMSIAFRALKRGTTSLSFANVKPMDAKLNVLPVKFVRERIEVK